MPKLKHILLLALAVAPVATTDVAAAADAPRVTGAAERVFDWSADRCANWDIPDTPARAWRDTTGRVHLVAGSEESRAAVGPGLDALAHDCAVLFRGSRDDDPGAYDDRAWIHATWAGNGAGNGVGGDRVVALAHVEYHGEDRPGRCASARAADCWRNAIVELVSTDGGRTFARSGLVAALPWRYSSADGRRTGYFNPSNLFADGGYLYAFVWAEAFHDQRRGACLIRRPLDGGPADWRAWDGRDFTVRFADPYREDVAAPSAHVCAPVEGVASTLSSVVRLASGRWLAVTPATRDGTSGIWWTTSADLVRWERPALLWQAPLLWRRDCAAPAAYVYPSLLDGDSASANFETADGDAWLYLVEMPLGPGCTVGAERDLVRIPVSLPSPVAPAGARP